MQLSTQQDAAVQAVSKWFRSGSKPFFYLAGFAGTGKTTLAKRLAEDIDGQVLYAAYTGKAAAVMRENGCEDATTIHRVIYRARERSGSKLKELREKLADAATEFDRELIRQEIKTEVENANAPAFAVNPDSELAKAALIVIDECSMVGGRIADDLLSFKVPILVLGDPAQLPPAYGEGYFTKRKPDFMLTEIHRQVDQSGILQLATQVRNGNPLEYCDLGDARVITRDELTPNSVPSYDQVLVGRNKTRRGTNARIRQLAGRKSNLPEPGERLVCLQNNHEIGLLNGDIWHAMDCQEIDGATLGLTIENGDLIENVQAWKCLFEPGDPGQLHYDRDIQKLTYGYTLTAHKAQGSSWPRVIVFDESGCFGKDWSKWLYTAITRASAELTIVK